jgi:hypothetical protein
MWPRGLPGSAFGPVPMGLKRLRVYWRERKRGGAVFRDLPKSGLAGGRSDAERESGFLHEHIYIDDYNVDDPNLSMKWLCLHEAK